jgi:hypothetical protein
MPNYYSSYRFEGVAGVGRGLALVAGAAALGANLPAAENAAGFVGITTDSLTTAQCAYATQPTVSLVRGVRIPAIGAGVITHGHWVRIANAAGQFEDCQTQVDAAPGTAAEVNVVGKAETDCSGAGAQFYLTTQEFVVQTAAS